MFTLDIDQNTADVSYVLYKHYFQFIIYYILYLLL
jgi:hypothetical protein